MEYQTALSSNACAGEILLVYAMNLWSMLLKLVRTVKRSLNCIRDSGWKVIYRIDWVLSTMFESMLSQMI